MVFDSKLKINSYHEHFPDTLEKYTRFLKFTLHFSISYVRLNGEALCSYVCCCFLSFMALCFFTVFEQISV